MSGATTITRHDHDGDALTIGCPACIVQVRTDQKAAEWADAPVRRCTWSFRCQGRTLHFTLDVRVPAGATPWQVDERYGGETGEPIIDAIATAWPKLTDERVADLAWTVCHNINVPTIGPIVPEVVVAADQPDLFSSAS